MLKRMRDDIKMVFEQDPAARSTLEVITTYAGLHAVWSHLIAHKLYKNRRYVAAKNDFSTITFLPELKYIQVQKSVSVYLSTMAWV